MYIYFSYVRDTERNRKIWKFSTISSRRRTFISSVVCLFFTILFIFRSFPSNAYFFRIFVESSHMFVRQCRRRRRYQDISNILSNMGKKNGNFERKTFSDSLVISHWRRKEFPWWARYFDPGPAVRSEGIWEIWRMKKISRLFFHCVFASLVVIVNKDEPDRKYRYRARR